MNTKLLDSYKNIELPDNFFYRNEPDGEERFRITDSPLAFLDLSKTKQAVLLEWCESLDKIERINTRHTSYGLKHTFGRDEYGFYIYNGAFKGAMIMAGFSTNDVKELNWRFNVSEKSIKDKIKEQNRLRRTRW